MTHLSCGTCGSALRPDARFCVACGNPVGAAPTSDAVPENRASSRCEACGATLGPGQQFCGACGAVAGGADEASPYETADAVIVALERLVAPFAPVVLLERPGTKRPRRCEVVTDAVGRMPSEERDRLAALLEETLVWDGYLFAEIKVREGGAAQCVWHVVNGETFGLAAEHATTLLMYFDALQPTQWSESDDVIVGAPELEVT